MGTPWVAEGDQSTADAADGRGDRLQKVLASAGVASRRECEQLILDGRVEVDGQIVTELGARVDRATQKIRVDGEALATPRLVYLALHKPAGVVTTARDPAGRPRVTDLVPPTYGRVFPVGRLDLESEGLILLTNDGDLADRLTHPRHGVHKVYEVQVAGLPEAEVLEQLRRGVYLSEGFAHAVDVKVKGRKKRSTMLEMVLDEGRNREVRRLLARVGHKVQRLTRVAVGPVKLGELPRGAHRVLSAEEIGKLKAAGRAAPAGEGRPRPKRPVGARGPLKGKPGGGKPGGRPRRAEGAGPGKRTGGDAAAKVAGRRIIGAPSPESGETTGAPPKKAKRFGPPGKKGGPRGKFRPAQGRRDGKPGGRPPRKPGGKRPT